MTNKKKLYKTGCINKFLKTFVLYCGCPLMEVTGKPIEFFIQADNARSQVLQ